VQVFYTAHARRRMAARRVGTAEVRIVLARPVLDRPSLAAPDRHVFTGWPDGRKVEVVVEEHGCRMRVITVWADRP